MSMTAQEHYIMHNDNIGPTVTHQRSSNTTHKKAK